MSGSANIRDNSVLQKYYEGRERRRQHWLHPTTPLYGLIVSLLPVYQTLLYTLSIFTLKILQAVISILFQQLYDNDALHEKQKTRIKLKTLCFFTI